jgi:hypothetical protein
MPATSSWPKGGSLVTATLYFRRASYGFESCPAALSCSQLLYRVSAVSASMLSSVQSHLADPPEPTTPTIISSHCRMQKAKCRMHVHICSHRGHGLFVETSRPLHPDCNVDKARAGTRGSMSQPCETARNSSYLDLSSGWRILT